MYDYEWTDEEIAELFEEAIHMLGLDMGVRAALVQAENSYNFGIGWYTNWVELLNKNEIEGI